MPRDNQSSSEYDVSELCSKGKFWEIFDFTSNDFTALELAKRYSALRKVYEDSPEQAEIIESAFAILNAPLTRQFYEKCRIVMKRIKQETGDKKFEKAEGKIWADLWRWVSERSQEPPDELVNALKVKHTKIKISDSTKRVAYEAWIAEKNFDASICWFCGKQIYDNESHLVVKMHKVLERIGDQVKYQPFDLIIPRCKDCSSQHSLDKKVAVTCAVITCGGGVISYCAITGKWEVLLWLIIPWAWIAIGIAAGAGYLIGLGIAKLLKMGSLIRSEDYYHSCPLYKVAINEGFVDGEKPS